MIGLKKKAIAVMSLCCLFLTFGTGKASAAGTAKIQVSPCAVERGEEASVAFHLENNPGIWGIKFRIQYDHSVLTLKSVTAGTVFEKEELTLSQDLSSDPYVVVATGSALENKTADGTIVTLHFEVDESAMFREYPIRVEVTQANTVNGRNVPVQAVSGQVTVAEHVDKNHGADTTKPVSTVGSTSTGDHTPEVSVLLTVLIVALLTGGSVAFLRFRKRRG